MGQFSQPRGSMFMKRPSPEAPTKTESTDRLVVGKTKILVYQTKGGKISPGDFLSAHSSHAILAIEADAEGDEWVQIGRFRWAKTRVGLEYFAAINGIFPEIGLDHPSAPWRLALNEEQESTGAVRESQADAWDHIPEDATKAQESIAAASISLVGLTESASKASPFVTLMEALSAHVGVKHRVAATTWSAPLAVLMQAIGLKLPWASPGAWPRHPLGGWAQDCAGIEEAARQRGLWLDAAEEGALDAHDSPLTGSICIYVEGDTKLAGVVIDLTQYGDVFCISGQQNRSVQPVTVKADQVLGLALLSRDA
jgi:hypothetical protein